VIPDYPIKEDRILSTLPENSVLSERYEIKGVIGQGGMGSVYLARDRRLSVKQWAVKELIYGGSDPEEKKEVERLFADEAHLLAQLDHPNLPKVVDFFTEGDRQYLVMEYIEGENLETLVLEGQGFLAIEHVLNYAFQIADVLSYLHNQKPNPIIFRDLKPANIMITRDDRIKLIDFGIARLFVTGKNKDTIILGTPGYASPEQYGKSQTDQRSDIFSFGATLYFALTKEDPGKSPFHFPPLSKFNPLVPPDLENIVLKAVSLLPESRYARMADIVEEMKKIGTGKLPSAVPRETTLLPSGGAAMPLTFQPQKLDFGNLKRGSVRQMSFTIIGDARGSLSSDKKWLKTRPTSVKGLNTIVDVIVDSQALKHGGSFMGNVIFSSGRTKCALPVNVTIQTQPLTFWNYVVAFLLTLFSFVPVLGFLGFFFMLSLYYSCPYEERSYLAAFMIIATVISIIYLIAILVLVAHYWIIPKYLRGAAI
jgi:serine/threonine protein kinase